MKFGRTRNADHTLTHASLSRKLLLTKGRNSDNSKFLFICTGFTTCCLTALCKPVGLGAKDNINRESSLFSTKNYPLNKGPLFFKA